jgi:transposase InsO family protein
LVNEANQQGCRKALVCDLLGISLRTYQRWETSEILCDKRKGPKTKPTHSLTDEEKAQILSVANSAEFSDLPPSQIVPKLADRGQYIASEASFYRVLKDAKQLKHRGKQRAPSHSKPKSLTATGPNQIWSWDISYLPTTVKGLFYYLYFFMDIFSRKIVSHAVYEAENADYAEQLIRKACQDENISRAQIFLHADNGSPMKASTFVATLRQLGITPTYSRPSVSNDNPYSEALFKTAKYSRWYPRKPFNTLEEANKWANHFVAWYNNEHLHSGLNFITPNMRHQKSDDKILQKRIEVYQDARKSNPKRWINDIRNWELPQEVHLNPSKQILQ